MLEVKGFRGFLFDVGRVGALDRVVTPPYDIITEGERRALAQASPYNMVHLILPEEEGGVSGYAAAGRRLADWVSAGVLRADADEHFYVIEQQFVDPEGVEHVRRGFFGAAKLPEAGEDYVLGHERTFADTLEDRFRLIEATRANLGPVFVLYADPANRMAGFLRQVEGRSPDGEAHTLDDVRQRLWRVDADAAVTDFFRDRLLYIADGHHRFGTARAYRDFVRDRGGGGGPHDYILLGFVSLSDPGLFVYPTHRLMQKPECFDMQVFCDNLSPWFELRRLDTAAGLSESVEAAAGCVIGMAIHGDGYYLAKLRDVDRREMLGADRQAPWRDLDVAVLHRGIIEGALALPSDLHFTYERDAAKAIAAVDRGEFGLAFLLKATRAEQIQACAEAGEAMPQKSTYFYPKLPAGMVLHRLV